MAGFSSNDDAPVLVTGGSGFVGGSIARRLLDQGRKVRVICRSQVPGLQARGAECIRIDLGDTGAVREACQGMATVFHVAAKVGLWGRYAGFRAVNVEGTQAIINGCRDFEVPRLVFTSSPSVIFTGSDLAGVDESLPYGEQIPAHYPATKAIAEAAVLEADDRAGLRTVALRPHLVWGPGDTNLVPRVVERARRGRLRIVGSGRNRVDLTYIDNVVDAHLLAEQTLVERPDCGGGRAYFITNGEPVELWTWINDLLSRLGIPKVEKTISLRTARRLGAGCECLWAALRLRGEPPMTRFVASELAKDHWFSIERAKQDLQYMPRVPMDAGLELFLNQFEQTHLPGA
ncbi:MAG: 3-beta hydroxysteroid dehydrogenase [Verrucomicrobia bacterium]|nr:MAG: 3-beta hydroxysteroid dehydrogenase [Verrucomicrobiota bacterium]